ncbi:MAG: hypothetical protein ACR2KT_16250 [Methylocella sp.]|nr:MAG: hypothetical protein DLM68_09760 [Hyphomicrobiales bacterium]
MSAVETKRGRPPGARNRTTFDVKMLSQAYTIEAVDSLVEMARDVNQPGSVRVSAWSIVLDRGWGRPMQTVTAAVDVRVANLSDSELRASIASMLNQAGPELMLEAKIIDPE